jgi:carnitine O-acetyltransferase
MIRSDVTPRVDPQLSRAAALILSSLSFIHDLRNGHLKPDGVRGTPLDMSQYDRLFGSCRVPTDVSPRLEPSADGRKGAGWRFTRIVGMSLSSGKANFVSTSAT